MAELTVRERVIVAADGLYNSRGIRSVGMDELSVASGVSLKALYGLFPSKSHLVLEVLEERHRRWTTGVTARVASVEDPRDKLLAIYDYLGDCFSDDAFRGCGFINVFAELGPVDPDVAAIVRRHKASFQAFVARLVLLAGGPPHLAPQLTILAEGAQTTAAIAGTADAAAQARTAAEVLVDAAMSVSVRATASAST